MFVLNESFNKIKLMFSKTFNSEFLHFQVWFTDKNSGTK